MNYFLKKNKTALTNKPSNAVLLLLTGFFFTLTMLSNILHTIHPHGGWETSIGVFTTRSILMSLLFVLSFCLIALWRSVAKNESLKETKVIKTTITKMQNNYSPIDYPRGLTKAVVSGYSIG